VSKFCGEREGATERNLIGRSTGDELVTEVRLVFGGGLVLDTDAINTSYTTGHKPRRASILVGEPEHARGLGRNNS
jgi:hypothetical protein